MGSEWGRYCLGDLIEIKHGWAFKGTFMDETTSEGPVVVGIGNFDYSGGFRFNSTKLKRYTADFPEEYLLEPGDVLLAMTCQTSGGEILGIPGIIPDDSNTYLHNQRLGKLVVKRPDIVSQMYLYWLFLTPEFNHHLFVTSSGTKVLHTSPSRIKSFQCLIPPLEEQMQISNTLWAIQFKIDLNRRMNETLEFMAKALFKSWFVDFDPVIDNALASGKEIPAELSDRAAGRAALGDKRRLLPAEISTLFPDEFTDSDELGWIPKGWSAGSFGDILHRRREKVGSREAVVLSAVASGELVRSDEHFTKQVYSKNIGKYLAVEHWDIAYNPSRINIGSVGMLKEPILGAVSPVYVVARPTHCYRWFVEFLMHREYVHEWVNSLASGSVRQSLSFDDFASIPCIIPPEHLTKIFDQKWTVFHGGINARLKKSKTLTGLRDTLLPKLLSGELRIPEAEKMVEELAL